MEIWQWPLYHNPAYFKQADDFVPERWLGDGRFVDDRKEAFQPFSLGARNCVGRKSVDHPLSILKDDRLTDSCLAA